MKLENLTTTEARTALRNARVALLPVGAIEQHGPHLPLATDWLIASRIAAEASQVEGRLLLPGFRIGVSAEHRQFWGTLTLTPELLTETAISVCRSVAFHDLSRIVLVNGHGTNTAPLQEAASRLRTEGIYVFVFNWWQSIASLLGELFPDPTAHAGAIETSLMLAIDPTLVRVDRFAEADTAPIWGRYVEGVLVGADAIDFTQKGNVGNPDLASPEKGQSVLAAACDTLGRFCRWLDTQSDEHLASHPHLD